MNIATTDIEGILNSKLNLVIGSPQTNSPATRLLFITHIQKIYSRLGLDTSFFVNKHKKKARVISFGPSSHTQTTPF